MVGRLSARVVGVVAVTGVAVAGAAVAFAWPDASTVSRAVAAPVLPAARTAVRTVDLGAGPGAPGRRRVDLPARATKPFSMVGITWNDPSAALRGTAQVRARGAGGRAWSRWLSLATDKELGPDTAGEAIPGRIRGATAPQWVGPSDGVQVRVVAAPGTVSDALPAGLRLELVDPGDPPGGQGGWTGGGTGGAGGGLPGDPEPSPSAGSTEPVPGSTAPSPSSTDPTPSDSPSTGPVTSPSGTPPVTPSSTPPAAPTALPSTPSSSPTNPAPRPTSLVMPPVVSRAAWRADESLNRGAPTYGTTINALFVHHTATTNAYTCAESPAIVRGIHAYHVRSNGWSDIGYNYLVDKCGTLFEGRKGGIERPVIGAHTYGFNTNSIGVAVIGTYIDSGVPAVVQSVLANLSAYRLGQYGHDPVEKVNLVAGSAGKFPLGAVVTMNRISGHRDGDATECPGDALYAQLAAVREEASG